MCSIYQCRVLLLLWMEMWWLFSSDFILLNLYLVCAILGTISMLLRPSHNVKLPKYWHWSLNLIIFPFIKILICRHSFFRLTTITSAFLLFSSNPFFRLSSLAIFNIRYKPPLFTAFNTVPSAHFKLFTLCQPALIFATMKKKHCFKV